MNIIRRVGQPIIRSCSHNYANDTYFFFFNKYVFGVKDMELHSDPCP